MMTNLMGELATARFDALHAEADRLRTIRLAKSHRRPRQAPLTRGDRPGLRRWVLAHR